MTLLWHSLMTCIVKGCNKPRDKLGHHHKRRGNKGSDGIWNRISLCRFCHTTIHSIGTERFCKEHPEVKLVIDRADRVERIWGQYHLGRLDETKLSEEDSKILSYVKRYIAQYKKKE